jgi:hypothetical protein
VYPPLSLLGNGSVKIPLSFLGNGLVKVPLSLLSNSSVKIPLSFLGNGSLKNKRRKKPAKLTTDFMLVLAQLVFSTLKMEATCSTETLVDFQQTI